MYSFLVDVLSLVAGFHWIEVLESGEYVCDGNKMLYECV